MLDDAQMRWVYQDVFAVMWQAKEEGRMLTRKEIDQLPDDWTCEFALTRGLITRGQMEERLFDLSCDARDEQMRAD